MKGKLAIIEMNLNLLIKRLYELKADENINCEVEQKLNEINKKIYELSDLKEEIETMEEL